MNEEKKPWDRPVEELSRIYVEKLQAVLDDKKFSYTARMTSAVEIIQEYVNKLLCYILKEIAT